MDRRKKKRVNLLYFFSLALGMTIIVLGFSVTKDAKTKMQQQAAENQKMQEQFKQESYKPTAGNAQNIPKNSSVEVVETVETEEEENFSPNLDEVVLLMPAEGEISVPFTGKSLIYSNYFDDWRVHKGIDIGAEVSGQVRAVANGTVSEKYKDVSLGNVIKIKHGDFETVYGNLSTHELVNVGDKVRAGDIISGIGTSSPAEMKNPHLHFEVIFNGEDVDPEPLLIR